SGALREQQRAVDVEQPDERGAGAGHGWSRLAHAGYAGATAPGAGRWTRPRAGAFLRRTAPVTWVDRAPLRSTTRGSSRPLTAPTTPSAAAHEPTVLAAARHLHAHIAARHLHDGRLSGPDQGVRWNIRVGRFVKSYLPFLGSRERFFFLQGQGYW